MPCMPPHTPARNPNTDTAHHAIASLLAQIPLFSGLTEDDLLRMARGSRREQYDRGNILFHKGDPCHGFHLIQKGQVKLAFVSADGNQKVVDILREGNTFGEAVMFMKKPYVLMAQALTDCQLIHVSKDAIFQEIERDREFCLNLIAGLSHRLHHLIKELELHSLCSGKERIIGYLLGEIEQAGDATPHGAVVVQLQTHKGTIASRLSLTQEHFSRVLHELVHDGMIQVEGRRILIPDVDRLRDSVISP